MGRHLTEQEKDDRKWKAAAHYLRCYADYKRAVETYGFPTNQTEEAWRYLIQARAKYMKVARLYG